MERSAAFSRFAQRTAGLDENGLWRGKERADEFFPGPLAEDDALRPQQPYRYAEAVADPRVTHGDRFFDKGGDIVSAQRETAAAFGMLDFAVGAVPDDEAFPEVAIGIVVSGTGGESEVADGGG